MLALISKWTFNLLTEVQQKMKLNVRELYELTNLPILPFFKNYLLNDCQIYPQIPLVPLGYIRFLVDLLYIFYFQN